MSKIIDIGWKQVETFLYYIIDEDENVKIGVSENPWQRVKDLQCGNAQELRLVAWISFSNRGRALQGERLEHERFVRHGVNGSKEWFTSRAKIKKRLFRLMRDYEVDIQGPWFDGITVYKNKVFRVPE
ncbi:MAG: GIY-YIG nuclease family protein [Gammaproteobacteria bacterium]|nr:GIY-YIG nuclease family protein [Gammaproteobacteria bacterium]